MLIDAKIMAQNRNPRWQPSAILELLHHQIRLLVRPVRETKESKKKEKRKSKERNLQWQTECSPRPPTLTQRYVVLHAWWSARGSLSFKFRQNRLNGFRDVGGGAVEICHFIYLGPVAYITACTTVQAVILYREIAIMFS